MAEPKILVVEDEAIVAMDLRRVLEDFGYQVSALATSGSEAIEAARKTRPDLVLMDVRLDGRMDGIEVAHNLRTWLDVPIVFLTAYSNDATLQRAKSAQPFGFLIKPFQERELRSIVEIALFKHRTERELHQRKSWLDAILRGMADCVIAADAVGFVTFMNPPAEALTGRTFIQARELTLAKALRLVDRKRVSVSLDTLFVGTDGVASALLIDDTGKETPVELSITRPQDENGRPEGTVVVFRDVSDRLKAAQAEASRRSEERLQALIDGGSDMIIVFDADVRIRYASPSVEQIVGYTPEEALEARLFDYIIPEDHETAIEAIKALREGSSSAVAREYRLRHRDGSIVTVEAVSTDLLDHPLVKGVVVNARNITEKRSMENALRQSERDYRGLFENANDYIVIFEPEEERILEANQRACEVYGFERSDFVGLSLKDFSENVERGRRQVDLTLGTDSVHRFETVHYRKDGSPVNLEITASVVDYQGTRAIYSIGRDVTERKRAEKKLLRANRRLEILNILWREIAAARPPREVVEAALEKLTEFLPCDFASVVLTHPSTLEATVFVAVGDEGFGPEAGVRIPLAGDSKCGLISGNESTHCIDSGVDDSACPLTGNRPGGAAVGCVCASLQAEGGGAGRLHLVSRDPQSFAPEDLEVAGEVAGAIGVALHQAHLQAEIADHEQRLQALLDNLPEGVVCLDLDYRVTLVNPTGSELLSLIADAGVGDEVDHLLDRPVSEVLGGFSGDSPHTVTVESSDHRTFELGVVNLVKKERSPGGHIIVIRELTRELETRRRLEQQDRLASVGQLAAGIAHDFNNMLQAISGLAHLIEVNQEAPSTIIEKARNISQQGQRGAGLVRQILDFSRTSVIERRPLLLDLVVKETSKFLRQIITEEVHVKTEIEPGAYHVMADPTQIQQILMNLAVNARDSMSMGGELTIRLEHVRYSAGEPRPFPQMVLEDWIRMTVRDHGTGMTPEVASRAFEPFFTTKNPGQGTGLGLAQVYGIVKQNEGFIDLETELGVGSAIVIHLPATKADSVEETDSGATPAKVGDGELVLLVEDEIPVREVVLLMLESLGFEVVTAGSGSEAIQVAERFLPDIEVVVSDVVLPDFNGVEVSKTIRQLKPGLPVLLMSGYPLGEDHLEISAETTNWISKPFTSAQFAEAIGRVIKPN